MVWNWFEIFPTAFMKAYMGTTVVMRKARVSKKWGALYFENKFLLWSGTTFKARCIHPGIFHAQKFFGSWRPCSRKYHLKLPLNMC